MVAFEISLNGKRLYACGAGDVGTLAFSLMSLGVATKTGPSHERFSASGCVIDPNRSEKKWQDVDGLDVGDEISVRIIEVDNCDPPDQEYPYPGRDFPAAKAMRDESKDNLPKPKDDEAFRLFPDDPGHR